MSGYGARCRGVRFLEGGGGGERARFAVALALVLLTLGGCASNGGGNSGGHDGGGADTAHRDPLEGVNRGIYAFNDRVDRAILKPVAQGYQRVVPDPVERSIARFFSHLMTGDRFVGALLQGDWLDAGRETGRFVVNTLVGVGGLFDPASEIGLNNTEEDIGQALAVWGLDESPYLIVPLLGPMTLVELPDRLLTAFLPTWLLGDYYHPAISALQVVSTRAEALGATAVVEAGALDAYSFVRESYLQRRRHLRYDGNPPLEDFGGFLDDADGIDDGEGGDGTADPDRELGF